MMVRGNKVITQEVFPTEDEASKARDAIISDLASIEEGKRPDVTLEAKTLTKTETFVSNAAAIESAQATGIKARAAAEKAAAEKAVAEKAAAEKAAAEKAAARPLTPRPKETNKDTKGEN